MHALLFTTRIITGAIKATERKHLTRFLPDPFIHFSPGHFTLLHYSLFFIMGFRSRGFSMAPEFQHVRLPSASLQLLRLALSLQLVTTGFQSGQWRPAISLFLPCRHFLLVSRSTARRLSSPPPLPLSPVSVLPRVFELI